MSEKACSVRLVTGTVILRNSKPHVLFLISPITSLHEHIATYEVRGGGGGGGALKGKKSTIKLSGVSIFREYSRKLKIECRPHPRI